MKMAMQTADVKVADEVWIATALLHCRHPQKEDFSIDEILQCALKESGGERLRPGVYVHIVQHCVANRPPNPGRYRMLYETTPGRRRLFRSGDTYDPAREGSKTTPHVQDIPAAYKNLLHWYQTWNAAAKGRRIEEDPLLALIGSGKHLWEDENPDVYVKKLREGWE